MFSVLDDFKDPSMEERVSKAVKPGEKPAKKTFFKSKKAPGAGLQSKVCKPAKFDILYFFFMELTGYQYLPHSLN